MQNIQENSSIMFNYNHSVNDIKHSIEVGNYTCVILFDLAEEKKRVLEDHGYLSNEQNRNLFFRGVENNTALVLVADKNGDELSKDKRDTIKNTLQNCNIIGDNKDEDYSNEVIESSNQKANNNFNFNNGSNNKNKKALVNLESVKKRLMTKEGYHEYCPIDTHKDQRLKAEKEWEIRMKEWENEQENSSEEEEVITFQTGEKEYVEKYITPRKNKEESADKSEKSESEEETLEQPGGEEENSSDDSSEMQAFMNKTKKKPKKTEDSGNTNDDNKEKPKKTEDGGNTNRTMYKHSPTSNQHQMTFSYDDTFDFNDKSNQENSGDESSDESDD